MTVELTWVLGFAATLFAALLGIFWKHLDKRFDALQLQISDNEQENKKIKENLSKEIEELRTEVYKDFTRRMDFLGLAKIIREDLNKVFDKLDKLREDVARLSGNKPDDGQTLL